MEPTPKAIEIQGITRHATKIGVQDGQAEDLINLRFMDGSWRASGDGRLIDFTMNRTYSQLYVHTNIYHHLLGVYEGTLYWFAEIGTDGTSFYPLDNTTSRTQWPEDMQDLPTGPKRLTEVVGNIWITQTGHLLTVIDENDDFEYFVFKTGEDEYVGVNIDINGKQTDRSLYPFGEIHFNLYSPWRPNNLESFDHAVLVETENVGSQSGDSLRWINPEIPANNAVEAIGKATKKNLFVNPFLACGAIRLYDGSFIYATNPVLLYPRQPSSSGVRYYDSEIGDYREFNLSNKRTAIGVFYNTSSAFVGRRYNHYIEILNNESAQSGFTKYPENRSILWDENTRDDLPSFMSGIVSINNNGYCTYLTMVLGSDLICSITNNLKETLEKNKDIFQSFCIFVTPEVNVYNFNKEYAIPYKRNESGWVNNAKGDTVFFKRKTNQEIINSLLHNSFFLLKEYNDPSQLLVNPTVDLSGSENNGILENLVQQDRFTTEALSRTTYLPKVSYMYNGRLHIANYKTYPFFGYPIDLFHLHNHSVKVQENAWFPNNTTQKVLPNLTDNNDAYLQYTKAQKAITNYQDLVNNKAPYFIVKTYIDSDQGEQVVCRYIQAYDPSTPVEGRADFIEDLNPLLTYPDARAKKMEIFYVDNYTTEDYIDQANVKYKACAWVRMKEFKLTPHPYLNMAYFMDPDLHPIKLADFEQVLTTYEEDIYEVIVSKTIPELKALVKMVNAEEYFPNGMKVSKPDNPMYFPVEKTYQVGSAEILAIMSSTIPLGTGQTGSAPLVVFCKDGVYALLIGNIVPDTEKVTESILYANAVPISRDVCNNSRSVTPVDGGIVFSTDRGLMMATYDGKNFNVEEIGQPAEGDVLKYADLTEGNKQFIHQASSALRKVANLPDIVTDTDFLTYLKDKGTKGKAAIINYNHNLRELIVSNPNYPYSYVMDREGNWSRRDYTAMEYVNNYPTSYRLTEDGKFYKLDEEGDDNTPLEQRKEADNSIFYLSREIKLDSIGFKQAYRFVVRGYFETVTKKMYWSLGSISNPNNMYSSNCLYNLSDAVYKELQKGDTIRLTGQTGNSRTLTVTDKITGPNRIVLSDHINMPYGTYSLTKIVTPAVGCYVLGSYDGRKWARLGRNERSGKFTDIGCLVERTDVKFFRVCLAGQVTGKTRIDYMEMSSGASVLNGKIR